MRIENGELKINGKELSDEGGEGTVIVCVLGEYMSLSVGGGSNEEVGGLGDRIEIDSAGIAGYHEGDRADSRMRAHAARRGYVLDSISRPVRQWDFHDFDLIIGMDDQNITDLKRMAPDLESVAKIHQMTEFSRNKLYDHVPDPYYSGAEGFELVLDLLEDACAGLLEYCKDRIL